MEMTKEDLELIYSVRAGVNKLSEELNDLKNEVRSFNKDINSKLELLLNNRLNDKSDIERLHGRVESIEKIFKDRKSFWQSIYGRVLGWAIVGVLGALFTWAYERARLEESPLQKTQIQSLQMQIEKLQREIK